MQQDTSGKKYPGEEKPLWTSNPTAQRYMQGGAPPRDSDLMAGQNRRPKQVPINLTGENVFTPKAPTTQAGSFESLNPAAQPVAELNPAKGPMYQVNNSWYYLGKDGNFYTTTDQRVTDSTLIDLLMKERQKELNETTGRKQQKQTQPAPQQQPLSIFRGH